MNNIFTIQNKEKLNTYFDKTFNYLISEEREKFIIFSKQINDSSKKILRDYIIDSFSKKAYSNYSNLSKKYKYIEKTIDFSRILHQYITIEKIKNPNNFLDINSTLFNFNDYSSVLNSKNHGNFILALLGKFFEINGMKAYILKKKDTNFDKIELSSIQTLFSLGTQRKYEIHFNFGKKRNEEILNNINKQNEFLSKYKKKISDILKIDINRIIFKDVRYGCVKASASFIDQSRREDIEIPRLRQMDNVIDVEKKVMVDEQILSPDILDLKGIDIKVGELIKQEEEKNIYHQ